MSWYEAGGVHQFGVHGVHGFTYCLENVSELCGDGADQTNAKWYW